MKQKPQRRDKASDGAAPKKPAPPVVLRATNRPANAPVKNGTPTNRSPQVRYTPEIAEEICARMAAGEALIQVCKDPRMPGTAAVYRWLEERPSFRESYTRARIALYDHWAEETIVIADDGSNDWMERETQSGRIIKEVDREHIARSRERIAARQWLTSKLRPGKYGEKLDLNVAGQPGGAPIQSIAAVTNDPVEAAKLYQEAIRGLTRSVVVTQLPTDGEELSPDTIPDGGKEETGV